MVFRTRRQGGAMNGARVAASAGLMAAAVFAVLAADGPAMLVAATGGLAARAAATGSLRRSLPGAIPVLLFAAAMAVVEIAGTGRASTLGLKTVAVYGFATTAFSLLPWTAWVFRARPGSAFHTVVLFALVVRHFVAILGVESRRVLEARALAVRRRWGRGWFRSLAGALAALFRRSLVRAERFYAAQSLRGLAR